MAAVDYATSLANLPHDRCLTLTGTPVPTPWDTDLHTQMRRSGIAIHEESLLATLLADLA